jgi:hypothetical protein
MGAEHKFLSTAEGGLGGEALRRRGRGWAGICGCGCSAAGRSPSLRMGEARGRPPGASLWPTRSPPPHRTTPPRRRPPWPLRTGGRMAPFITAEKEGGEGREEGRRRGVAGTSGRRSAGRRGRRLSAEGRARSGKPSFEQGREGELGEAKLRAGERGGAASWWRRQSPASDFGRGQLPPPLISPRSCALRGRRQGPLAGDGGSSSRHVDILLPRSF